MQGLMRDRTTRPAEGPAEIEMPEWLEQKVLDEFRGMYREAVQRAKRVPEEGAKQLEESVRRRALEIGARIYQAGLGRGLGKGYEGSIVKCEGCGERRRYVEDRDKMVTTTLGEVRIRRAYYHCSSCKRGKVPLDGMLKLEGRRFSSTVQEAVCLLSAEMPFERAQDLLERLSGVRMSAEECRRIAEGFGRGLEKQAQDEIDKVWKPKTPVPREIQWRPERLYVSPDGTHVPTKNGWTEAKVATIFTTRIPLKGQDPIREHTRYVAGIESSGPFFRRLYAEALKQGVDQAREVVVVADGAHWIWRNAELSLPKKRVEIIDYYHATEKVWAMGRGMWGEESLKAKRWAKQWCDKLYQGNADGLISAMKRLRPASRAARELKRTTIGYFQGNRHRMRYGEFRKRGYFIGSGATESSCKHLVGSRLKQAGMRWDRKQAQAILQLRTARLNDRWNHLWN